MPYYNPYITGKQKILESCFEGGGVPRFPLLGGGFNYFLFSRLLGEMILFDEHMFQMGGSTTKQTKIAELIFCDSLASASLLSRLC